MANSSRDSAPSVHMKASAPLPGDDQKKKQNAIAQALFRARKAAYIKTLEETVTNLEEVVLQLQESVREHETSQAYLQQENNRLEHDIAAFKQYCNDTDVGGFGHSKYTPRDPMDGLSPPSVFEGPYPSSPRQNHPSSTYKLYPGHQADLSYPASFSRAQPSVYPTYPRQYDQKASLTTSSTQCMRPVARASSTVTSSAAAVLDDHHQHSIDHKGEVTPYGGMANVTNASVHGHINAELRYTPRRELAPETLAGTYPAILHVKSQNETMSGAVTGGLGGDAGVGYAPEGLHSDTATQRSSRSSSPGTTSVTSRTLATDTLAIIKKQAFGALRKTGARKSKKSDDDDAARMSKEALEARGIQLGMPTAGGTKRRRIAYEEDYSS